MTYSFYLHNFPSLSF
uniref:Uncharacterized protein n=1 Tax=Anguilla anguilla TaxID=7936 RepID=A0A0E9PIG9_ANGAN